MDYNVKRKGVNNKLWTDCKRNFITITVIIFILFEKVPPKESPLWTHSYTVPNNYKERIEQRKDRMRWQQQKHTKRSRKAKEEQGKKKKKKIPHV